MEIPFEYEYDLDPDPLPLLPCPVHHPSAALPPPTPHQPATGSSVTGRQSLLSSRSCPEAVTDMLLLLDPLPLLPLRESENPSHGEEEQQHEVPGDRCRGPGARD